MRAPVPAAISDRDVPPARPVLLRTLDRLSLLPRPLLLGIAVTLAVAVALADFFIEGELSLVAMFIVPVLLITWANGFAWGCVASVACLSTDLAHRVTLDSVRDREPTALSLLVLILVVFVVIARLVAELHAMLADERRQARTDPLTGAVNRRAFHELLQNELDRATRYRRPLSLAYLDLDRFKQLNDMRGHDAGDTLLRAVVHEMQASVRASDRVARLGGDEFCVLAPETDADAGLTLARRLDAAVIRAAVDLGADVTASIGFATFDFANRPSDEGRPDIDALLRYTDTLMYRAKQGHNGQICSGTWEPVNDPDADAIF